MKQLCVICLLLLSSAVPAESENVLSFVVNHPGSKPYLYFDVDTNSYKGIVPDVLQGLIDTEQLTIDYISNNRRRSEEMIYQGSGDLTMLSLAWVKHPNKVIATEAIHQHRSFLYSAEPFASNFSLETNDIGQTLCTRANFVYPSLTAYFDSEKLIRLDSSSHLSMLRMLFKGRCDFVVMNEFNALNLINSSFFENEIIYRGNQPIGLEPLQIVLRPTLVKEKKLIDAHIMRLKRTGELGNIIDNHTRYRKN